MIIPLIIRIIQEKRFTVNETLSIHELEEDVGVKFKHRCHSPVTTCRLNRWLDILFIGSP
jgi:hypothetical protein